MAINAFLSAEGTITQAPTAPGEASTIVYGFTAQLNFGAAGIITRNGVKPNRWFPDDTWTIPARIGDPCTVKVLTGGTIVLLCPTEQVGVVDCAAEEGE